MSKIYNDQNESTSLSVFQLVKLASGRQSKKTEFGEWYKDVEECDLRKKKNTVYLLLKNFLQTMK